MDDHCEAFVRSLKHAADAAIPVHHGLPRRRVVPWWSAELGQAIRARRRALRAFRRAPSDETLAAFRRLRARARYLIKQAKRRSWRVCVFDFSPELSL